MRLSEAKGFNLSSTQDEWYMHVVEEQDPIELEDGAMIPCRRTMVFGPFTKEEMKSSARLAVSDHLTHVEGVHWERTKVHTTIGPAPETMVSVRETMARYRDRHRHDHDGMY
ncbi:hypothetical protein SEA_REDWATTLEHOG_112 [Gordonia phage RedWattleHog]|uniref:Uncharacterized protein n=1 Tax=Gordonia phage Stormageddon TaxID=2656541 RepID=A0A649VRU1_9CAUD|nr:hypothetical protein KHQ86_gp189 [Gordonia phage Stormageddon]QGJ94971.1 hypothetical protein SEA_STORMAGEDDON_111 [Gordonia phage Stormageddon]QLF83615.1 hypothetical protein SEA_REDWATTLEHOG_112 [Gordonia phage RedWattleHog]